MSKLKLLSIFVIVIVLAVPVTMFFAMKISPLGWGLLGPVNETGGLAIKGYDPVAYFNQGRAIRGDTTRGLRWNNAIWYFASDENKLMFKTFPEKFSPQFGGYCANAVLAGFTADVDPEIWHIENNRLYLFFDEGSRNEFVSQIDPALARLNQGIIGDARTRWQKTYK